MTKTKMSTVAIVVLSVLLAAALAATIVLAAFSFTGKASTTLTFGGGVTLEVTGVTGNSWNSLKVNTDGTITSEAPSNKGSLAEGVSLDKITVKNTSSVNVVVAVGYTIEKTGEGFELYVDSSTKATAAESNKHTAGSALTTPTSAGDAVTAGTEGATWKTFKMAANAASAETVINYIHSVFNTTQLVSGASFTGTVYIVAVPDADDAITNINAAISQGKYADFS